jgi:mono/diheme cytochrome c family protein
MRDGRRARAGTGFQEAWLGAAMRGVGRGALGALLVSACSIGGGAWAADGDAPTEVKGAPPAAAAPAGDAARGRALFIGTTPLASRAMPCIGCHNASDVGGLGGGTLASDLSDAGTRHDSLDALAPLLGKDIPIPAMQAVYGPRPLTEAEIADLAAYLVGQKSEPRASTTPAFFGLGLLGMLILVGVSQILWRNRLKGVRRQLTGGR